MFLKKLLCKVYGFFISQYFIHSNNEIWSLLYFTVSSLLLHLIHLVQCIMWPNLRKYIEIVVINLYLKKAYALSLSWYHTAAHPLVSGSQLFDILRDITRFSALIVNIAQDPIRYVQEGNWHKINKRTCTFIRDPSNGSLVI